MSERYVGTGLSHSVPLTVRLVEEYNKGFESRYIEYPTPLLRYNYISNRVVNDWNSLPERVVEETSLNSFKAKLDDWFRTNERSNGVK
ncbi:hypothetical protein BpHYR1_053742, partial [Brachionus plicatilis]